MTSSTSRRVGYVGLGNLGFHLAHSLLKAGHQLTITDLNKSLAEPLLVAGATWSDDAAGVAQASDVVFTCLPSPRAIESVLTGANGILAAAHSGLVWVDNSTNDRDETLRLAAIAAERGVRMLEAPVTGGVHKAAAGDITVLAGGDDDLFHSVEDLLAVIGNPVLHMGELGNAAVIKVITNMLAFIHLVAAGEALMLAKRGGLDLTKSFHAILNSSGNSFVHETESQVILNGSYNINFTMDLAVKDLGFAMEFGKRFGVPLDLAGQTMQTFIRARSAYGGNAWSSQVVKLLEDALDTDLRAPGFPAELE